jgi:pyruvate,water dikinase
MSKGKFILEGMGASQGIVAGRVRVVNGDEEKIANIQPGEIIVADKLRPEHDIYMKKAAGFITNVGGVTSHVAIVAREWEKPAVVGTMGKGFTATDELKDGQQIVLDGLEGKVYVYEGPSLHVGKVAPSEASPIVNKMAEMAASKGLKLDPAFLARMKNRS